MKILKLLLLFVATFLLSQMQAQQLIVHDTTFQKEYFVSKSTAISPYLNQYLTIFSKKTFVVDPYFKYKISVNLNTTNANKSHYQIHCTISKDSVQGNTTYLGFDLGNNLFPNSVEINIAVMANRQLHQFPLHGIIPEQKSILGSILVEDTSNSIIAPYITSLNYNFNQQWLDEMLLQLKAIESYTNADSLLQRWDSTLNSINLNKTELIPLLDFELDELTQKIAEFTNLNLVKRLHLSQKDTNGIAQKITTINIKAAQKQLILNEYLMNIDQHFVIDARKYKESGNILQAINSFNKALEYHRYNIVALNELAKLYYEIGNLESASMLIKQLFSVTYPDDFQNQKCIETANLVYRKIVNQGNDMLVAQNFSQAIQIYQNGDLFCDSIREPICNGEHLNGIKKAKNGIYQSYINVIQKALQQNLISIAQSYAKEAHNYQLLNKNEIGNDADLQKFVDIIVSKQLAKSSKQIQNRDYIGALNSLENADSIGRQFRPNFNLPVLNDYRSKAANGGLLQLTNEVESAIKLSDRYAAQIGYDKATDFKRQYSEYITDSTALNHALKGIKSLDYQNLITVGNQLCRLELYQNALTKFTEAKELQTTYQFSAIYNLDSILNAMSKPLIADFLSIARQHIWGNNFDLAFEYIQKADTLLLNIANRDTSILLNRTNTKSLYDTQRCEYYKNGYLTNYANYLLLVKQARFIEAEQCLDSMQLILKTAFPCNIENKASAEDRKSTTNASRYQRQIQDARYQISIHKIEDGLSTFFRADSLYLIHKIDSNILKREQLTGILIFAPTNEVYFETCAWLSKAQKLDEARSLIALLEQKGIDPKKTKKWKKIFDKARSEKLKK